MSKPSVRQPPRVDRLFRAMSDPIRLRILHLLLKAKRDAWSDGREARSGGNGEVCVCDIQRVIGAPQPTISRHLAYLRGSGLVRQRRKGLWMYYRLDTPRGRVHRKLLECLDACASEMPRLADDVVCLCTRCGNRECCE